MKKGKMLSRILSLMLVCMLALTGCGNTGESKDNNDGVNTPAPTEGSTEQSGTEPTTAPTDSSETADTEPKYDENKYIELALNVYYNDADTGYYKNEAGSSIKLSDNGTYTLTFDCEKDLSADAKAAGVTSLTNLTAVYILDMGIAKSEKSSLSAANILYKEILVDGNALTITQKEPKSAFKSSGAFDTNDPINAWDGSLVEEVNAGSDHVANFTSVTNPKKITITFTLSDMVWGESAAEETSEAAGSGYTNTAVFSNIDFTNVTALEVSKYMGNGINLGNTFEAYGRTNLGTGANVSMYETFWGQPVTTKAMVQGMKNCGFDTIRIPVAWTNMMDYDKGDYTINSAYLDRVEEVVNYALESEMFVVLNDHWDGGWWAKFGSSNADTVKEAWAHYESMWKQIAERFKDYPDMLIFESANEELGPGLNNNSDWADSGKLSADELYKTTNEINQKFVDIVRKAGGNNTDRFLLIAGYNTNFDNTLDSRFKMPNDTAKSKLILSVHYYDPWNYCGTNNEARWGLKSEYEYMDGQFEKLTKFTDAGYGIIIGEYAAIPVYDSATGVHTLKENTVKYTNHLLDLCDVYNYVPLLWSTNDFFNKKTLTMINPAITSLFTSRCYAEEVAAGDAYIKKVKENMASAKESALEMWEGVETYEAGTPVAWIMWNGGAGTYSVGDTFNPADNTAGITATNAIVTGAGEYSVSLDFANGNNGLTFSALAIADGELLYPNCVVLVTSVMIDGKKATLTGSPYTSSDDGKCTRVNLYNEWVSEVPKDARSMTGLSTATPTPLDKTELVGIYNITVNFRVITK
ncbi:MAG: glycoside hydrolase family 5 protein [Lachnospiraceae bacterium]|nr:glycoside hydrolase family 5 protein [Lachnospiraceae bacterium]